MATHYCIGNPCWICFPEYAPKTDDEHYEFWKEDAEERMIPEFGISGKLHQLLVDIFIQGLDEDTFYMFMDYAGLSIEDVEAEIKHTKDLSFESQLIGLLIDHYRR